MNKPTVTVSIPDGDFCKDGEKPCVFARYTKKWHGYNCMIYHKILKGENSPRKCFECKNYCNAKEGVTDE